MYMIKWLIKIRIKQLIGIIWHYMPCRLQSIIQTRHANKKALHDLDVYTTNTISKEDVVAAMGELDLQNDVLIHSSLQDIGNIEGRHKTFIEYLDEKILLPGKNILSIAIPVKGSTYEYLKTIKSFDATAPNAMGVITKQYMKRNDAIRSLNPTHSVVVVGPLASYYTSQHHIDATPFTVNSPYYKLLEKDGDILMIGADIKHLTICHLIEDLLGKDFPYDVYARNEFDITIKTRDGDTYKGKYKAHDSFMGSVRVPDYILYKIKQLPSTHIIPLGNSELIHLKARDVILCMLRELRKGMSIYGYRKTSKIKQQSIDRWIDKILNMS